MSVNIHRANADGVLHDEDLFRPRHNNSTVNRNPAREIALRTVPSYSIVLGSLARNSDDNIRQQSNRRFHFQKQYDHHQFDESHHHSKH